MNILCVDDEVLLLNLTVSLCKELPDVTEVTGFWQPQEALAWAKDHAPDVALLDIDMPGMSGLELAKGLKEAHPDTAVIFLTGYAQYAVDAFAMHASGYLLKPVDKARLAEEIAFAAGGNGLPGMPDKEARCPADIGAEAQERFRRLGKEQEHGKRNTLQDLSG